MATSLDVVRLDLPCQVPWSEMHGDDRVRFCTQCNLDVHNLSAMTEGEAAAFLAMRGGDRVCVAYKRRHDGSSVFAPAGTARGNLPLAVITYATPPTPRRRWLVPTAIAGAVVAAGATAALKPATRQIATGGTTMVAGGIGPAPAVAFDPSNPTPACGSVQTIANALRFDDFAKTLNGALPAGLAIVDVRYSVYPIGGTPCWGQAYTVAAPAVDPATPPPAPHAVIWLLPSGTRFLRTETATRRRASSQTGTAAGTCSSSRTTKNSLCCSAGRWRRCRHSSSSVEVGPSDRRPGYALVRKWTTSPSRIT